MMPSSGAHHIAADNHAFQQRVRIALDLVAVHVCAGIALVCVADDVFLVGLGLGQEIPFVAGQESGAAAAAKLRRLELLDDAFRTAVDKDLVKSLISAHADVFFNVLRIDKSAVPQNDLLLALKERHFVPGRYFGIAVTIPDTGGDVVPLLDLAVYEVGRDVAVVQARAGCVPHR